MKEKNVFSANWARIALLHLFAGLLLVLPAFAAKRPFTVLDDIRFAHFGDPYNSESTGIKPAIISPDRKHVAIYTESGLVLANRPQSVLRIYRIRDIEKFLASREPVNRPSSVWSITKSTFRNGPIITHVRWLTDSSGLAFLSKTPSGNDQLLLADVRAHRLVALTPRDRSVTAFDIRDRRHFVCALLRLGRESPGNQENVGVVVGTGHTLTNLLFPAAAFRNRERRYDRSELWVFSQGKLRRLVARSSGQPITIYLAGQRSLALSPDSRRIVTALPLASVPATWRTLYPSGMPSSAYRIRSGPQDLSAANGNWYVSQYVLISLAGKVETRVNAPIGTAAGWWSMERGSWSSDGRFVLLSNTFLPVVKQGEGASSERPCLAVFDSVTGSAECVAPVIGEDEHGVKEGWRYVTDVKFAEGRSLSVEVRYDRLDGSEGSATYRRVGDGHWEPQGAPSANRIQSVDISVKQGIDEPPVMTATDTATGVSRVFLDPNPWLTGVRLGDVQRFEWKDAEGRTWVGGLYKPPGFVANHRYPLVIQTHGFEPGVFEPSGIFPTAFAARALAGAGILVLQAPECPVYDTPQEGPCNAAGYDAAIARLTDDGMVDSDRVGIIGFSRTCFHVLEALTTNSSHYKAASITDGVNEGYLQYLLTVDEGNNIIAREAESITGAPPFGKGLQRWQERAPTFNLDRITAALQVVALDRTRLLSMWEPYAVLRYLRKPVDLILLGDGTHILSNPAQRLASQGGTVDWFRFWLQDYVDPDPRKAEQYNRWMDLKKLETN